MPGLLAADSLPYIPGMRPQSGTRTVISVRVALAVGLLLVAIALGVVLSRSPLTVAGTNSIPAGLATTGALGGKSRCQPDETLPRGTSAIRVSVVAIAGPRVTLQARSRALVITHGERGAGWGVAETTTVPVNHVLRTTPNTEICIAFGPALEPITIHGAVRTTTVGGGTRAGVRFRVEYLRPGHTSWWSMASSVARRMGLGHSPTGTWIAWLIIALMITVAALASRLILRELR